MAQSTMYPAIAGSPKTALSSTLSAAGTTAYVDNLEKLPAAPNLVTFWINEDEWERCIYSAKSAVSGPGTITIARSGAGHASYASNAGFEWVAGTKVARNPGELDHSLFKANIEDLAANKASSTTGNQTIWVDKAATGAGTGVDKTNAFTTIAAAIESLPAIINHEVTIKIVKGSTAYNETITIQRVVSDGSITLRGEYYWYGTNAGTKTGKLDLGSGDFGYSNRAQIAAGDLVWATKWSGTVSASTPSESIIDTVASVSDAELTLTTNTTKSFDTTWTYQIVKTIISGTVIENKSKTTTITGFGFTLASSAHYVKCSNADLTINYCYVANSGGGCIGVYSSAIGATRCYFGAFVSGSFSGVCLLDGVFEINNCVLTGVRGITGLNCSRSRNWSPYNHILPGTTTGIYMTLNSVGYFTATRNDATTPKTPATSTDASYIV